MSTPTSDLSIRSSVWSDRVMTTWDTPPSNPPPASQLPYHCRTCTSSRVAVKGDICAACREGT